MTSKHPTPASQMSPSKFTVHDETTASDVTPKAKVATAGPKRSAPVNPWYGPPPPMALLTSKMSNLNHQRPATTNDINESTQKKPAADPEMTPTKDGKAHRVDKLLASLDKVNTSTPPSPTRSFKPAVVLPIGSHRPKAAVKNQDMATGSTMLKVDEAAPMGESVSSNSENDKPQSKIDDSESEIELLKKELAAAKGKIQAMDQELTQQRITNDSLDAVLRSPSEPQITFGARSGLGSRHSPQDQNSDTNSARSISMSTELSGGGAPLAWNDGKSHQPQHLNASFLSQPGPGRNGWNAPPSWSGVDGRGSMDTMGQPFNPQPHRPANLRLDSYDQGNSFNMAMGGSAYDQSYRRTSGGPIQRAGSGMSFYNGEMSSYPGSSLASTPAGMSPPMTPMSMSMHGFPHAAQSQYNSMATALSPTASEFNARSSIGPGSMTNPWAAPSVYGDNNSSSYITPSEPMNYRKLMDRQLTCDWKYIVDKIVCSNDQQASIFLQQKLKVANAEQKFEMIESIIGHSYPLMINRFGNFLIQRCLEHGTPEQVVAIANAIRGNVLNLSMDAFGCHVVQKALDVVPEPIKASMVHELLHRIPETVIHRYACHVWQKLFELRWTGSPPQIMKRVNEALRGMWHEVALGETGSLVVQNIFENCLEDDKRPCINEVLSNIDMIAHGQFGNWCIQHICEHGLPPDKSRAIEHVLRFAADYSIDQFASKVVEKCLKVGGPEFMDRYLERVCEGRPDRPRMPLIDIAGDQFGNYIIQYILINAGTHHREIVCNHVRKHMVSLRGSKFGSRVAMLCTNPAFSTRPGPPVGAPMMNQRYMNGPPLGPSMSRSMSGQMYRYNGNN